MNIITHLAQQYSVAPITQEISKSIEKQQLKKIQLEHIYGSLSSILPAAINHQLNYNSLWICKDYENAAYRYNELKQLYPTRKILFFPAFYMLPYEVAPDNANILMRAEVLSQLFQENESLMIVSFTEALLERVLSPKRFVKQAINLRIGDIISIDFLNENLYGYHFKRVDFVTNPGEFSIRGGIVDIFSYSNDKPYRISFFGDEIEHIRSFSIADQLSISVHEAISILPNLNLVEDSQRITIFNYLNAATIPCSIVLENSTLFLTQLDNYFEKAKAIYAQNTNLIQPSAPEQLYITKTEATTVLENMLTIELETTIFTNTHKWYYKSQIQPSFNKKFEFLADDLIQWQEKKYQNYIICAHEKQAERLENIFQDLNKKVHFQTLIGNLHQGFIDEQLAIVCYTDHQIFERYHAYKINKYNDNQESLTLKELNSLKTGDYITHIDHGIGKFAGLMQLDNNGIKQEVIKLIFQNNDILYVNIHALYKISRYSSKEGVVVKLNKLGSNAWKNLKQKTKTKVKEIAFDLIKLYAKRRTEKGYAYAPDTYLQHELEASFMYEDTPDQLKAVQAVKNDMESERVMDRLICGDVGFGKTEVAIRAAFKAITEGKQVAILVPTTILAFQHYRSFSNRLAEFPVNIDYLNRFRSTTKKKEIITNLKEGKIDLIIGTHQLVAKEIIFKDLGLLIIDEEHKFGVSVKDKLKTFKENIDTLTLTATPIPRTLQFSLMAARDLSVIKTPPNNRQPITTQNINFNEEVIRDGIFEELQRGGQVFFIHNRIENIKEVANMLQRLIPDARIAIGHARLPAQQLETLMLDFMEGKYDILVSTTIIESGLDVPNANTIFINQAHHFGLADLHQMRGRVGRSNVKAYCYLITPPQNTMTEEAQKRLQALAQFSDLGSGFNIAMKDLEIRGAGNLLGAEQSGFIHDIGFDIYQKILQEAIQELQNQEFKDLFEHNSNDELFTTMENTATKDILLDWDIETLIEDSYVNQVEERLQLYQTLSQLNTETQLNQFTENLIDRFGALPPATEALLESIRIKWLAVQCGFERMVFKRNTLLLYFIKNNQHPFYQTGKFQELLSKIHTRLPKAQLKERKIKAHETQLLIRFDAIPDLKTVYKLLSQMLE